MRFFGLTAFLILFASGAPACEIAASKIVFPRMGTHIAYYCKATEAQKKQAIEAALNHGCLPAKLRALGKPPVSIEATDVIPYWYTKSDAEKAGPILETRITLEARNENGNEKRKGYRVLATGHRTLAAPPAQPAPANNTPIRFELSEPALFERDCPVTGCVEHYSEACENRQ